MKNNSHKKYGPTEAIKHTLALTLWF